MSETTNAFALITFLFYRDKAVTLATSFKNVKNNKKYIYIYPRVGGYCRHDNLFE